ncbi:CHAP domain-containing protein [Actinomadura sp. CNU-125]|uniref:CHAP domain-containing protein n=1 Tax=Actinomadura sp. CNU-125 TaxID=1904961 RepID=UPI0009FB7F34|nr:CHAP domain-containing protein [Actinomadura sp. CNU-125]
MSGRDDFLREARKSLGLSGRPNYITRDYARRHGNAFLDAPWCDMSITYWARHAGTTAAVLPGGDRAFTPWHAGDFQKIGRWHTGTVGELNRAEPGDVVFFDWGYSNSIGAIDHVGVIEKVLGGGRVQTIEGNTGDACKRRVRSASVIAGYGRPAWDEEDDVSAKEVWDEPIDTGDGKKRWKARTVLGHLEKSQDRIEAKLDAQQATIDKLVDALGAAQGVDLEALKTEIRQAIEGISVRLDVEEPEAG